MSPNTCNKWSKRGGVGKCLQMKESIIEEKSYNTEKTNSWMLYESFMQIIKKKNNNNNNNNNKYNKECK